ncbi:hypothetical protein KR51_00023510 [Rubidibacter lacunae KORDI 51-2]|uniref:Uncharacterized protein n=1 Tax=Rubidibacter lacunae KORDI 51-2 TaxID=582515 RepID=U5DN42_9CHRO|nr:hypothetical protein KR51_00023510 [Rubidibacter lacunae KORDI 51-2]
MNIETTLRILFKYADDWQVVLPEPLKVSPQKRWLKCVEHLIHHNSNDCIGLASVRLNEATPNFVDFRPSTPKLNMFPPWAAYPKSDSVWGGWRQGYGDGYLQHWSEWLSTLSDEQYRTYFDKYPIPIDDRLWYEWFQRVRKRMF